MQILALNLRYSVFKLNSFAKTYTNDDHGLGYVRLFVQIAWAYGCAYQMQIIVFFRLTSYGQRCTRGTMHQFSFNSPINRGASVHCGNSPFVSTQVSCVQIQASWCSGAQRHDYFALSFDRCFKELCTTDRIWFDSCISHLKQRIFDYGLLLGST